MTEAHPSQVNRQFRLDRIVEVLELASSTDEGIRLSDVAAGLGIPTSTAYRLLGEMRRVGMLQATNGRGRHRLTKRFADIGTAAERNKALFAKVEQEFSALAEELGETMYLVKMQGRIISLVGYVKPLDTNGLHPGNAFPIHASAAGKILWSHQSADNIEAELVRPHTKFQDNTHVDPEEIRDELRKARERGFGIHDEEWDKGVFTMALPIFAHRATPTLSLGVIASKERFLSRFSQEEVFKRLAALRDKADELLAEE